VRRVGAFLARWGGALALMAVIFVASATPGDDLPDAGDWDTLFKKSGHFFVYAVLGAAYLRGLAWGRPPSARDAWYAVLLAALYAASDELHQRFTPGRSPALGDVAIDVVGSAVGAWLRGWWVRRE
jgi:VanZ family protein